MDQRPSHHYLTNTVGTLERTSIPPFRKYKTTHKSRYGWVLWLREFPLLWVTAGAAGAA
jgi:hypothetical protein